MSTLARCIALLAGLFMWMELCAAPAAVIEGVQMPAWVEREGSRMPLIPGMELKPGDRLQSGGGARILVRLVEGSTVKLGENGTLVLESLDPAKEIFKAALRVFEGAFRFTTDVAARSRRRDISVRIETVTAGIRGTDLWGRSRSDQQIVCLLEGAVEVGAEGETPVTMDQPLQFYRRLQGSTQPVGFIEKKQLDQWARETEIEPGKGAARRGGRFSAVLASAEDQGSALAVYDQLRAAGYAAQIVPVRKDERTSYTVRIANLASQTEAQALAAQLRGKHGLAP